MLPLTAYNIVHDELMLDGNSRLNLATFVSTWIEPEARILMAETFDKNMIDKDEYPQTAELELRCVNMLSRLWNSPDHEEAVGCSTIGSSEAAMLGGLALKWKWRDRMKAANKPTDRPNLVISSTVQVCWDKFCRYFDVEPRLVPVGGTRYHLTAEEAIKYCDENTIGVVAIMGSTFDGRMSLSVRLTMRWIRFRRKRGGTFPSMLMEPAAPLLPLSYSRNSSGTFAFPGSNPSTPRGINSVWSIQGSDGSSGATRTHWRKPGVQSELSRWRDGYVCAELLASGQPDRGPILQLPASGEGWLSTNRAIVSGR